MPRARLRQYELLREIGRGGMGTVYLARDTRLARRVAIKFLADISLGFTERFLVEARATARCSHENIVVIHEVNEVEGQPYMVLEYLDGSPLRRLLGEPMAASRAVELIVPVVRALAHAHGYGIVHRDLKPENIFVTSAGQVKVLDFGIAKLFSSDDRDQRTPSMPEVNDVDPGALLTEESALVGTLPYMSPEQWGADTVDHRSDIWAAGTVLYEMLAGRHPLAPITRDRLLRHATDLELSLPPLGDAVPDVPGELEHVVSRCLRKRKDERFESATELLAALEGMLPRRRRGAGEETAPYPGLTAFRAEDADLFHGRDAEINRMVARLRDRPLAGIVGPSGAGKSSFVRAGVLPALAREQQWESVTTRPGRQPLESLASSALALASTADARADDRDDGDLAARLRSEPGALGELLRQRARSRGRRVLLYVNQFEELYTLADDAEARQAYLACLLGAADDPMSPVRIVVSIRSDFLDRLAENSAFIDAITPGLMFLAPPSSDGLRAAIAEPAAFVGYRFESDRIVNEMVSELAATAGALPLLQFAAGQLWDQRDRKRRLLTEAAYQKIGGIAGALAGHGDAVIAGLSPAAQPLARQVLERLVTPERTRDVVEVADLLELGDEPAAVRKVIDHLVNARLLVVQGSGGSAATVELVHESLIETWPTLRRWLEQNQDDAAFLARLRAAAKPWDEAGRPDGLLWRAEAMTEARLWHAQYRGELGRRERAYLQATFRLADRATRTRRIAVGATIVFLLGLVVAAAFALVWIRSAERSAVEEADRARAETERARNANTQLEQEQKRQAALLHSLQEEQTARQQARSEADQASEQVQTSRAELQRTNVALRAALQRAEHESAHAQQESERAVEQAKVAETARRAADDARARAEALARKERERADLLERQRGKMATSLK